MPGRIITSINSATVSAMPAFAVPLQAQEFPNRPIRIATADSAGTFPDTVARSIGPEVTASRILEPAKLIGSIAASSSMQPH